MKIVLIFAFIFLNCVAFGQTITIDENFRVNSTRVKFNSTNHNYIAYSTIDNRKQDSLKVHIESIGLQGHVISLNLIKPISVKLVIYSDSNEFNGMHYMEIELESYELIINNDKFKIGDSIMGAISGESKVFIIGNSKHKICFDGYFYHIVGKVLRKQHEGNEYDLYDPRNR